MVIPKVLEDDEGCEQVSRSYHIANLRSSSKSPKGLTLMPVTSFGNLKSHLLVDHHQQYVDESV